MIRFNVPPALAALGWPAMTMTCQATSQQLKGGATP